MEILVRILNLFNGIIGAVFFVRAVYLFAKTGRQPSNIEVLVILALLINN